MQAACLVLCLTGLLGFPRREWSSIISVFPEKKLLFPANACIIQVYNVRVESELILNRREAMKARFYGYSILILCLTALLASCKSPTSSPSKAWVVSTLAGSGTAGSANGTGTAARFNSPAGVAVDSDGNIYVADRDNNKIRKITGNVVSTLAGSTRQISGYKNGSGTATRFNYPTGVAVDKSGNVYVTDGGNNRIRKIIGNVVRTLSSDTRGFADGTVPDSNSSEARNYLGPRDLALDTSGNIYVADYHNNLIRKLTADGKVETLAGGTHPNRNTTFRDGTNALFNGPHGIAVHESSGNIIIYVADYNNHRIRKIEYKFP